MSILSDPGTTHHLKKKILFVLRGNKNKVKRKIKQRKTVPLSFRTTCGQAPPQRSNDNTKMANSVALVVLPEYVVICRWIAEKFWFSFAFGIDVIKYWLIALTKKYKKPYLAQTHSLGKTALLFSVLLLSGSKVTKSKLC